jgi:hypothetical protein
MKATILCLALLVSGAAQAACLKYCDPAVSKPCGNSCIQKELSCRKDWATTCSGKRPSTAKKAYSESEVKHVEPGQEPKAKD